MREAAPEPETLECLSVRFYGLRCEGDASPVIVGTLLLHPQGDSVVVGPDGKPSVQAVVDCLAAVETLHAAGGPVDPNDPAGMTRALTRALLWKIADLIDLVALPDGREEPDPRNGETLQ